MEKKSVGETEKKLPIRDSTQVMLVGGTAKKIFTIGEGGGTKNTVGEIGWTEKKYARSGRRKKKIHTIGETAE